MDNTNVKIYCDGGARGNPGPAAAAFIVEKGGKVIYQASRFLGQSQTNNFAEYQAVLLALEWLVDNREEKISEKVTFVLDSELVVKQLTGVYKIKNQNLKKLFLIVNGLEKKLNKNISYENVPRSKNKLADFLVNKTLDNQQ